MALKISIEIIGLEKKSCQLLREKLEKSWKKNCQRKEEEGIKILSLLDPIRADDTWITS